MEATEHQEHPIGLYLKVWLLLFVLSACSYLVDYAGFQGFLRWGLILVFMFLKAGFIIAVFMHMAYERLALAYAIIAPPSVLAVLIILMSLDANYTFFTRMLFFSS